MDVFNNTERERMMENRRATDSIVLSIAHANQRLTDPRKTSSADMRHISGGIVHSIANIRQLFKDVMRTSNSMQKAYSDVADLALKIRIQQVAFDNGCTILLVMATKSRQDVNNMLEDPGHPIWKDAIAHRNLDSVMARFYHFCLEALGHFQEKLGELKSELHALKGLGIRKAAMKYLYLGNRSCSPRFGTTEGFPKLIQSLRSYNDIFCTLVRQAAPRSSDYQWRSSFGEDLGIPYAIGPARTSRQHFVCIQRASQALHDTLSSVWKCGDHEAHSLHISLNFDYNKVGARFRGKDFRFNVIVASPCYDSPYRLVIDTAHGGFCVYQACVEDQSSSNEMCLGNRIARPAARIESSELSEIDADINAHRIGGQRVGAYIRPESLQHRVADLGLEKDLCSWLRKSSVTIERKQDNRCCCLGFMQTRCGLTFLVSNVLKDGYPKQVSHSLNDVLTRANKERRAIPLEQRLRTALLLAAGTLHLNTGSWLRQVWSSKDVHFFDVNDCEKCALGEPFLKTGLKNETARGSLYKAKDSAATRLCLLSLGLVLIELAFSAPWHKLQLQQDIAENLLEWERNYLNLMRLSDTVSRELGSRYANVVQTCLDQGLEAKETQGSMKNELDEGIFEDIVIELDRCLSAVTFNSGVQGSSSVSSFTDDPALESVPSSTKYSNEDEELNIPPPQARYGVADMGGEI